MNRLTGTGRAGHRRPSPLGGSGPGRCSMSCSGSEPGPVRSGRRHSTWSHGDTRCPAATVSLCLPPPAESESPVTFQQMLQTLWKRKLTILVCIVVAVGATLAYSKYATPTYESSALVQINTPAQVGGTTSTFTLPDPVQELLNTNVQIAAAK